MLGCVSVCVCLGCLGCVSVCVWGVCVCEGWGVCVMCVCVCGGGGVSITNVHDTHTHTTLYHHCVKLLRQPHNTIAYNTSSKINQDALSS